jgi:hypothetical protein
MEMREFTSHDWSAFAGAEAWHATSAEGALPLIADGAFDDGMSWVLVLDRNGACLVCDDEQAAFGGYALRRTLLSAAEARAFATSLGTPKTRGEFFAAGFTAV